MGGAGAGMGLPGESRGGRDGGGKKGAEDGEGKGEWGG